MNSDTRKLKDKLWVCTVAGMTVSVNIFAVFKFSRQSFHGCTFVLCNQNSVCESQYLHVHYCAYACVFARNP